MNKKDRNIISEELLEFAESIQNTDKSTLQMIRTDLEKEIQKREYKIKKTDKHIANDLEGVKGFSALTIAGSGVVLTTPLKIIGFEMMATGAVVTAVSAVNAFISKAEKCDLKEENTLNKQKHALLDKSLNWEEINSTSVAETIDDVKKAEKQPTSFVKRLKEEIIGFAK